MQSSPTHQQYYERASQVIRKSPSGRTLPGMPSPLPDPSAFPDPYPSSRYNNPTTTTPPVSLFSAGSSSARSSAYTSASPGSALRSSVASSDSAHGHRHPPQPIPNFPPMNGPNSSAPMDGFGISHSVPPLPTQPLHAPYSHQDPSEPHFPNPYDDDASLNASAIGVATTADEIAHSYAEPLASAAVARQVASRPGSRPSTYAEQEQTRWSSSSQADSGSKSSSWGNFDPNARHSGSYEWNNVPGHQEGGMTTDDEDVYDEEPDRTAAVVLAEEGKGHIVRGEGVDTDRLEVPQGTTHLLLGASATPNRLPIFLATILPLISDTLLALDISANFLPSLPPALAACTNLEELNIGSNPLRAIPTWLGSLVSIRVLIVDFTGIASLPTSLSGLVQLHTLSIRRNRMHSLPSWLCLLLNLEALYVEGNPFQGPWKALLEPLVPRPVAPFRSPAQLHPPHTPHTPHTPQTPHTANSMAYSGLALSDSDYPDSHGQQLSATAGNPEYDGRTITTGAGHAPLATPNDLPWQQDHTVQRGSMAVYPKPHISIAASANTRPRGPSETLSARPNTTHGEEVLGHRRKLSRTKTTPTRRVSRPLSFLNSHLHNQDLEPESGAETHAQHQREDSNRDVVAQAQQPPQVDSYAPPSPVRRMKSAGDIKHGVSGRPAAKSMHESSTSKLNVLEDDRQDSRFFSLGSRGPPKADYRALTATVFDPSTRGLRGPKDNEKEKSKWGFLKKISTSVSRPRTPVDTDRPHRLGPPRQMSSPLQNPLSASSKLGAAPAGLRSTVSLHSTQTSPPRRLTKKPSASTLSVAHTSTATLMPPGSNPPSTTGPMGQIGPLPAATLSTPNLLTPTNPPSTPRSQKRRSFLPVDGPGPITVPGPPPSNAIIVTGDDDQASNTRLDGISSLYYSPSPYDDERERERHVRGLRSVMAYLRDMCDLNAGTNQGAAAAAAAAAKVRNAAPLSVAQTPDQPRVVRSRGVTLGSADASQVMSDVSFSTITSSTGFTAGSTSMSMFSQNPASVSFSPTGAAASIGLAAAAVGLAKASSFGDYDSGAGNRNSSGSLHNLDEKKHKDDKGKRAMIVKEIVNTERTYVKGMQELVDIYVKPASAPVTVIGGVSTKETVVPANERKIAFNGLESLLSFHKESFLPSLEKAYTSLEHSTDEDGETSTNAALAIARVFVSHAAFMRMYSTYINNFDNSVQRIKKWSEKPSTPGGSAAASATGTASHSAATTSGPNPSDPLTPSQRKRIKQFLKRCRTHPRHSQLNLEGYLLLPVQRIPRYRLLLEELVRATPPKPDTYDDPLDRALAEITNMASSMNEGKRDAETRRKLVHWQSRIRGKFPSPLVQPHRRLIMDGRLKLTRVVRKVADYFDVMNAEGKNALISIECLQPEVTPRSLTAILCNDLLVLCKDSGGEKDSNGPVDLWAVLRMQTVPQPASVVHGNTLRLVDNKAILYFEISTPADASTWARAINMHIPTISK